MLPAALTAHPVSTAVSTKSSIWKRRTGRPTDAARVSPRASTLRCRPIASPPPATTARSTISHGQRSERVRSPSSQKIIPRSRCSSPSASSRLTSAPQPAATTMPVRSSRVGVHAPPPCARANTSMLVASAPSAAAPSTPSAGSPTMIAINAATDAPPETPSTYGSASGLRSSACSSAPVTASSPPIASADIARGNLSPSTTSLASVGGPPVSASSTSRAGIATLPVMSDSASTATAAAASAGRATAAEIRIIARDGPRELPLESLLHAAASRGELRAARFGRDASYPGGQVIEESGAGHLQATRHRMFVREHPPIGDVAFGVTRRVEPVRKPRIVVAHHHDQLAIVLEHGVVAVGARETVAVVHRFPPVVAELDRPVLRARWTHADDQRLVGGNCPVRDQGFATRCGVYAVVVELAIGQETVRLRLPLLDHVRPVGERPFHPVRCAREPVRDALRRERRRRAVAGQPVDPRFHRRLVLPVREELPERDAKGLRRRPDPVAGVRLRTQVQLEAAVGLATELVAEQHARDATAPGRGATLDDGHAEVACAAALT